MVRVSHADTAVVQGTPEDEEKNKEILIKIRLITMLCESSLKNKERLESVTDVL